MSASASTIVADYSLDGNALDGSGNGYHGAINGAVPTTDRFGNENGALNFDGTDDNVMASSPTLILGGDFTFSVWIKPTEQDTVYTAKTSGSPEYYHDFVIFPFQGGDGSGLGLSAGTNGVSLIEHGNNFIITTLSYQASIGTDWVHLAVSVAEGNLPMLYVNGVHVDTGLDTGRDLSFAPLGNNTDNGGVGGNTWGYFDGSIDDLTVYDSALGSSEVANLFAAESVPEPTTAFLVGLGSMVMLRRRR